MTNLTELTLCIGLEPPSGNHYKKHRVVYVAAKKKHMAIFYHSQAAKDWFEAVALTARGRQMVEAEYDITILVLQGAGSRGDCDNFAKCALDSLVHAKVIRSDASVRDCHIHKRRDRDKPGTEILIRALPKETKRKKIRERTSP